MNVVTDTNFNKIETCPMLAVVTIDYRYTCTDNSNNLLVDCPPATTPIYEPN